MLVFRGSTCIYSRFIYQFYHPLTSPQTFIQRTFQLPTNSRYFFTFFWLETSLMFLNEKSNEKNNIYISEYPWDFRVFLARYWRTWGISGLVYSSNTCDKLRQDYILGDPCNLLVGLYQRTICWFAKSGWQSSYGEQIQDKDDIYIYIIRCPSNHVHLSASTDLSGDPCVFLLSGNRTSSITLHWDVWYFIVTFPDS